MMMMMMMMMMMKARRSDAATGCWWWPLAIPLLLLATGSLQQRQQLAAAAELSGTRVGLRVVGVEATMVPANQSQVAAIKRQAPLKANSTAVHAAGGAKTELSTERTGPAEATSPKEVGDGSINERAVFAARNASHRSSGRSLNLGAPAMGTSAAVQDRERKFQNALAARRNLLSRGGGTNGSRARLSGVNRSTSTTKDPTVRVPTDAYSSCIRNCTSNFTKRPRAICVRQCASLNKTENSTSSAVIMARNMAARSSSANSVYAAGDTNEILFSDESSHGFYVVTKDQNDTLNHIPGGGGSKLRRRGTKPAQISTPSSIRTLGEDERLPPYVVFRQKLPPIKPSSLEIKAVSNTHPRLLEVSASQESPPTSTTSTTVAPSRFPSKPTRRTSGTLSPVERSRSRFKFNSRNRGAITFNRSRPELGLRSSFDGSKSEIPAEGTTTTTARSVVLNESDLVPHLDKRTELPAVTTTRFVINVASAEEKTPAETFTDPKSNSETELKAVSGILESSIVVSTSTSAPTTATTTTKGTTTSAPITESPTHATATTTLATTTTTTTTTTTAKPSTSTTNVFRRPTVLPNTTRKIVTTARPIFPPRIAPNFDDLELSFGSPNIQMSTATITTTVGTSTRTRTEEVTDTTPSIMTTTKPIVSEDTEKLRAMAKNLTRVVEDQKNLIIFCNTTQECMPKTTSTVRPLTSRRPQSRQDVIAQAEERDSSGDQRRANIITLVLASICVLPMLVLASHLARKYVMRCNSAKDDEDFDVCITDQQPISPVKKIDSKYRFEAECPRDEVDHHLRQSPEAIHSKFQLRDVNYNESCDDKFSLASEYQEFDRNNIRLKGILGQGNFGQVWKAEVDNLSGHFGATRIVAVKTIRACSAQASLKDEVDIMRKLGSHPNVVTLLGACVESEPHMLILEYAMRGRLLSLLRAARNATNILPASVPGGRSLAPLSPRTLAGFALDIACGMEYIAERRIVHRDLAARNVLLDHNGVCKICDFGMSVDLDAEHRRKAQDEKSAKTQHTSVRHGSKFRFDLGGRFLLQQWQHNFGQCKDHGDGKKTGHARHDSVGKRHALPIRWMAPESLQYHTFTTETDIWAFGIVLWELATLGSTPYGDIAGREVVRRVPNGLRPDLPKESRYAFQSLMSRCWHKEPHLRPPFSQARLEISRALHKWIEDDAAVSDYMDISGFSEDLEHGVVYFNHRISEFECEI